jgi:hypothetical protein
MKKIYLLTVGFLTLSFQGLFAQMDDGSYSYANNEITINFTIVEDGWTISTITMTDNATKNTVKGSGEYRSAEGIEWYEFQMKDCNFSFDLPSKTMTLEQYDCTNNVKNKQYILLKK